MTLLAYSFFLLLSVATAYAGEVKIVDAHGLTRAMKQVSTSATVIVQLKGQGRKAARLTNLDGVGRDLESSEAKDGAVSFREVTPGVWRVEALESSVVVKHVKIKG